MHHGESPEIFGVIRPNYGMIVSSNRTIARINGYWSRLNQAVAGRVALAQQHSGPRSARV